MNTVSNLWWLWVIGAVLSTGYAFFNQINRMKSMSDRTGSFTDGLYGLIFSMVLNLFFMMMLIMSAILNIIDYVKK